MPGLRTRHLLGSTLGSCMLLLTACGEQSQRYYPPSAQPQSQPATTTSSAATFWSTDDSIFDTSGPACWALAVNSNPPGAQIDIYDLSTQRPVEKGQTPFVRHYWQPRTENDAIRVRYQGNVVEIAPERNKAVFVDFSQAEIKVEGGRRIPVQTAAQQATATTAAATTLSTDDSKIDASGQPYWALAVNSNPPGAKIDIYDLATQRAGEKGQTPFVRHYWQPKTENDAIRVRYQGHVVEIAPDKNKAVFVDFSQAEIKVDGGRKIKVE
jgi:hypothetical protein